MDRIAHDIRRSNWLEILKRSQQRPVHTTIKQWYLDSGISEKSYYYWQRKFRQEAGAQVSVPTAVFKYKDLTVAVTNAISDTLLSRIIREVPNA